MKHRIIKPGGRSACGPLLSFCASSFCHSGFRCVGLRVSRTGFSVVPDESSGLVLKLRLLSCEAAPANSLGRQPKVGHERKSFEPRSGGRLKHANFCRRFAAQGVNVGLFPWADAQGYLLPSHRDSRNVPLQNWCVRLSFGGLFTARGWTARRATLGTSGHPIASNASRRGR